MVKITDKTAKICLQALYLLSTHGGPKEYFDAHKEINNALIVKQNNIKINFKLETEKESFDLDLKSS